MLAFCNRTHSSTIHTTRSSEGVLNTGLWLSNVMAYLRNPGSFWNALSAATLRRLRNYCPSANIPCKDWYSSKRTCSRASLSVATARATRALAGMFKVPTKVPLLEFNGIGTLDRPKTADVVQAQTIFQRFDHRISVLTTRYE